MGGLFGVLASLSFFSHKGYVSACVSDISNTGLRLVYWTKPCPTPHIRASLARCGKTFNHTSNLEMKCTSVCSTNALYP